jgi:hypothetical protein
VENPWFPYENDLHMVGFHIYLYIYISLQEGNEWVLLYLDLTGFLTTGVLEAIQVAYPNQTVQNEPR